jgi:DNA polymerase-3 subunit delta'
VSLADVRHQGHAQKVLQRAITGDRVHHAYIFHGPDGVGKEMLARGLAQFLLCSQPIDRSVGEADVEALGVDRLLIGCGHCDDCRPVATQSHPDLHLIYRQLNREHPDPTIRRRKGLDIGVDVLRHFVIDRVGLTPARGRAKLFIIREADRITPQAQNALLKTLEEPPGATVIVLLVSALDRLLPTTLSRCQVVRFDPLPKDFTRGKLAELLPDMPSEQVEWYAACCDGSLGLAMERAEDEWFELNQRLLDGLARLDPGTISDAVKAWTDESKGLGSGCRKRDPDITDTEATRRGLKAIFFLAATYYADVLRVSSATPGRRRRAVPTPDVAPPLVGGTPQSDIVNAPWHAQIERAAQHVDAERAGDAISRITQAERQLDLNANTQLVLETLLTELANVATKDATRLG